MRTCYFSRLILIATAGLILAVLLNACSRERAIETSLQERIDSGEILVIANEDGPLYEGPLFRFEQDLVIGGQEDGPEWQLFRAVYSMLVGPDGRMYIVDRNDIFIVSPEGELIRQIGGSGHGPGEFEMLYNLHWDEDGKEFWAQDRSLLRMTRYSADGDLIDTFHYGEDSGGFGYVGIGNGRLIGTDYERSTDGREIYENIRFEFLENKLTDKRFLLEYTVRRYFQTEVGSIRIPFQVPPRAWSFPDGRFLIANPHESTLLILDNDANPLFLIGKPWEYSEVSSAGIAAWKESYVGRPTPYGRAYSRKDLADVPIPKYRQLFVNYRTDNEGRLWVQRSLPSKKKPDEERPPMTVDIFDRDGRWLGYQTLEFVWNLPIVIRDGYLYHSPLITRDSDEAPRVVRYRIIPLFP